MKLFLLILAFLNFGSYQSQNVGFVNGINFDLDNPYNSGFYQTIIVNNNIWFSAGSGDIIKYDIVADNLFTLDEGVCAPLTISNEPIFPLQYTNDTLLFYYKNSGLFAYAKNTNSLNNIDTPSWSKNFVYDNGAFWHSAYGTNSLHKEDHGIQYIFDSNNSNIPDSAIVRLCMGLNGEVWILYPGALGKFESGNYTQYDIPFSFFITESKVVLKLITDVNGNLWVINNIDGILKFNGVSFSLYSTSNSNIPTNAINDITSDDFGNIWLVDDQGNIIKFDGLDFQSFNFTSALNLSNSTSVSVNPDDLGNIWITTTQGLVVYNENQIQGPLGILDHVSTESLISVYPNPSGDFVNIKLSENESLESVTIYSALGELISSKMTKDSKIDIRSLPSGLYLMNISTSQGLKHSSFIKE